MVKSTSSDVNADDILTHLCTTVYDPKIWTSGAKKFVIHWDNQARVYNDPVKPEEEMKGPMKTRLLQRAVKGIPELRTIETTAKQVLTGGTTSTGDSYLAYLALLQGAAQAYDQTHNGRPSKVLTCHSQLHEVNHRYDLTDDRDDQSPNSDFDINTDIREINLARSRSSGIPKLKRRETYKQDHQGRPYLQGDLFCSLTEEQKEMWETWTARLKEEANEAKSSLPSNKRALQMHEVATPSTSTEPSDSPKDDSATDAATEDNKIMSFLGGTREELDPSDIRSVLSTTRQVRQHEVIYRITQSNRRTRSQRSSIVDRGATGGCGTNDLCLLETTRQPPSPSLGLTTMSLTISLSVTTLDTVCRNQSRPRHSHLQSVRTAR